MLISNLSTTFSTQRGQSVLKDALFSQPAQLMTSPHILVAVWVTGVAWERIGLEMEGLARLSHLQAT